MSVPNISYIRNQAARLLSKANAKEDSTPVTTGELGDVIKLIHDLAGFVDLECQNIHVRTSMSRMRP